ncbi:MAG: hypothetical protein JNL28_17725 [Planctomycetes bacterium]|nr:hypothetical protein [Planctomycetota bacterium]
MAISEEQALPPPTSEESGSAPSGSDFEAKYVSHTKDELRAALAVLREQRLGTQKRILEERERAGLYTKVYVEQGKKYNFAEMARSEVDRRYPAAQTRFATHVRGGNNQGYVEISAIPPGEYPEFDALQNEELWLHAQLRTPTGN